MERDLLRDSLQIVKKFREMLRRYKKMPMPQEILIILGEFFVWTMRYTDQHYVAFERFDSVSLRNILGIASRSLNHLIMRPASTINPAITKFHSQILDYFSEHVRRQIFVARAGLIFIFVFHFLYCNMN